MTVGQLFGFSPEELQALADPKNLHELRRSARDLENLASAATAIPCAARAYAQAYARIRDIIVEAEERQACSLAAATAAAE